MVTVSGAADHPRALLDVNVLIALLDASHASHDAAMRWFAQDGHRAWASCPITQNGCLRVMSSPSYPMPRAIWEIAERLTEATAQAAHAFWADDLTLLNAQRINWRRIHGSRKLTDVYLLALAVQHQGRFVTFDRGVPITAVHGATRAHLLVL